MSKRSRSPVPMRKGLGDKRREIPLERAQDILKILADFKTVCVCEPNVQARYDLEIQRDRLDSRLAREVTALAS